MRFLAQIEYQKNHQCDIDDVQDGISIYNLGAQNKVL